MAREVFEENRDAIRKQVDQILDCAPSAKVRELASVVRVFHKETARPLAEVLHTEFGMVVVTFRRPSRTSKDTSLLALEPFTDDPLQPPFPVASARGYRFPPLTAALLCAYITDGIRSFDLPSTLPSSSAFGYRQNWSEEAKLYLRIANHGQAAARLHAEGKPELAAIFDMQDELKRLKAIRDTQRPPG